MSKYININFFIAGILFLMIFYLLGRRTEGFANKSMEELNRGLYLDILKRSLLDDIYDSPESKEEKLNGTVHPSRAHTMIGDKRLSNIEMCFKEIVRKNIPGDTIETGVWRGGACIFMAGLNKSYNQNRTIYVADSFEGLPPPDKKYSADNGDKHHTYKNLAIPLNEVRDNFARYKLLDENVKFIKGFFENSLKNTDIKELALLRLDGDMYSSTIQVLDYLYDKVSVGGYIIVDDYALSGCKKAIDDFRKDRKITSKLEIIDWSGRYWIKE